MSERATAQLIKTMQNLMRLESDEYEALIKLSLRIEEFPSRTTIAHVGDRPVRSFMVLGGLCAAYKETDRGGRQVTALFVPGDIPDLQTLHLATVDCDMAAYPGATLAFILHDELWSTGLQFPRIAAAWSRHAMAVAARHRDWLLNIGQRRGPSRVAHFLCEYALRTCGLGGLAPCPFPLTQADLGEIVGLSVVHVNRSLMELRESGWIELQGKQLNILNWEQLAGFGDFDEAYLHLGPHPRLV